MEPVKVYITVAELIEQLKKVDGDRVVICQRDPEGNGFSPFKGLWTGVYVPDLPWSGEAGLEKLTDEYIKAGYTEEDVKQGISALFLYPLA